MENIIVLVILIVVLGTLHYLFYTSKSKIKEFGENEKLNKLVDEFPNNTEICKKILLMLGNKTTKIVEDEKSDTSLYLVMTDKIIVSNLRGYFTRVQTIAHECIHSMQDKKILWFNFIFSNLYIFYFIIISILTVLGMVNNSMLQIFILTILGFTQYTIRSYLETDAMIKARYLARNYMRMEKKIKPEEVEEIVGNYDILNKVGVQVVNYDTAFRVIIKIAIYSLISYIL